MNVQVKPPRQPPWQQAIPAGWWSTLGGLVIFGWTWSEFYLLLANDWTSLALAIPATALAGFLMIARLPLPRLLQALALGVLVAVAVFRFVTIHETSDADALGGVFVGILFFFLVSIEQFRLKG